jgi:hypothetical protein
VLKAERFVQPDGRGQLLIGLQIETRGAGLARRRDGLAQKAASDARSLARFRDRHLGDFKLARADRQERAAADPLPAQDGEENSAAAIQNGRFRIGQTGLVLGLQGKITQDPLFVETPKRRFVPLHELAKNDLGRRGWHDSLL